MASLILDHVRDAYTHSIAKAGVHMSGMLGQPMDVRPRRIEAVSFESLYEGLAPPETPMAMLILRISGDGGGFLVFMMFEESARRLNEHLWDAIAFDDIVVNLSNMSALKELANVAGSAFINELADRADIELRPSEPHVLYDMIASVLQMIVMENAPLSEDVILIDSDLADPELGLKMHFLFFPSPELESLLEEKLAS